MLSVVTPNVMNAGSGGGIGIDGVTHPARPRPKTPMTSARMNPNRGYSNPRSTLSVPDLRHLAKQAANIGGSPSTKLGVGILVADDRPRRQRRMDRLHHAL